MQILVSCVNAHWKVKSVEEDFTKKIDVWPVLWIVVNLFSWPSLALPTNISGHTDRDGMNAYTHGLDNMDFCWPDSIYWVSNLPAAETNTESPVWHHFPRWSTSNLRKVDHIGAFPLWDIVLKNRFLCGYGIAFPSHNMSVQASIHRRPSSPSWYTTRHCFRPKNGLHSQGRIAMWSYS